MSEIMPEEDRIHLSQNPYQGPHKRVLCVCSGGILRSPTAAWVLGNPPYEFNTRAVGTLDFALLKLDGTLLGWADEVVCMERHHADEVVRLYSAMVEQVNYPRDKLPRFKILDIPDNYGYREPKLIELIREAYDRQEG